MHLGSLENGDMKRLQNRIETRREKMLLSEIGSQVNPW